MKLIVGKVGMGKNIEEEEGKTHKEIHSVFLQEHVVYAAINIEQIKEVHWKDLNFFK